MIARLINMAIGTWVFVAAFAFHNPPAQFVSMLILGLLVIAVEVGAMWSNSFRYLDMVLGLYLAISGYILPVNHHFVLWNNLCCGIAIGILSMFRTRLPARRWDLPPTARRHTRRPEEMEA